MSARRRSKSFVKEQSSESRRQKAALEQEKARRRYSAAIDDLFRIYDIRLIRRERIDGHDTILATLNPKEGVKPQTDDGKIMRNFTARAWVSESDYELVRVEVEAIRDLSFGLGLLARVHKGTVASYERRKVNTEVWLPAKVTWTAAAGCCCSDVCAFAASPSSPAIGSSLSIRQQPTASRRSRRWAPASYFNPIRFSNSGRAMSQRISP